MVTALRDKWINDRLEAEKKRRGFKTRSKAAVALLTERLSQIEQSSTPSKNQNQEGLSEEALNGISPEQGVTAPCSGDANIESNQTGKANDLASDIQKTGKEIAA